MPLYSISTVDKDGNKINKMLEFTSEIELYDYLDTTGMDILDIKARPFFYKYLDIKTIFATVRPQEVIEILENLQIIIRSGLPANTGLFDLANDSENPAVASMLSDIAFHVQTGETLSKAVEKYRKVFGDTALSLIRIGEETGSLDVTLKDASAHLRKIQDLKSKAKSAMMYPMFSFVVLSCVMIFWLVVVMPEIIDAFSSFGVDLPLATRMLQSASTFMIDNGLFTLLSFIALIIAISFGRKKSLQFRYITDKILLKIPFVGALQANFTMAFFAEYTRLMIASGLPLYEALTIIEGAISNTVYKRAIINTREGIAGGSSFSEGLRGEGIFPLLIIRMLSVGEQTGRIEEQLEYIAEYYYIKVDYLAQNIAKIIEPIILVIMGAFILIIMLGLLGPVYDLIGAVQS